MPPRSKYGAVPIDVDGIRFASKREAARYRVLAAWQEAGKIAGLRLQPRFTLEVNGEKVGVYVADFEYLENGARVVEDVKGVRTPVYRLKKRIVRALYGIEVREV